jgi:hypothetical protein
MDTPQTPNKIDLAAEIKAHLDNLHDAGHAASDNYAEGYLFGAAMAYAIFYAWAKVYQFDLANLAPVLEHETAQLIARFQEKETK